MANAPLPATLTVEPTNPAAGTSVSITLRVTNNGNSRKEIGPEIYVYEGEMSYQNPNVVRLSSEALYLPKGETFEKVVQFSVPADKPSGTLYTAHARVLQGGGASFHDAQFTVA
jgi:hypothetical protein